MMRLVVVCLSLVWPFLAYGLCPFSSEATVTEPSLIWGHIYEDELAHLRFADVFADLFLLLEDSQECWPADEFNGVSSYGPLFIRLAWHCSGTFRNTDGVGGCAGGRQRFYPESAWEDNTNLDKARALLVPLKDKYGNSLSWGDLMVFAGTAAIMAMGGPVTEVCAGRIDDTWGNKSFPLGPSNEAPVCEIEGNCARPLGTAQTGLIYVDPAGFMGNPDPTDTTYHAQIRDVFDRMGMNDTETVALIGGGHAFGKCHGACPDGAGPDPLEQPDNPWPGNCGTGMGADTFTSGFEGQWTSTPLQWSNEYFTQLIEGNYSLITGPGGKPQWMDNENGLMMLTTDLALIYDDAYYDIVAEFANNTESLNNAFGAAWEKLVTQGNASGWAQGKKCIDAAILADEVAEILSLLDGDDGGVEIYDGQLEVDWLNLDYLYYKTWDEYGNYDGLYELACRDDVYGDPNRTASWYVVSWTDTIFPILFYYFNLTAERKEKYISTLEITTCCEAIYIENCAREVNETAIQQCREKYAASYSFFCGENDDALDTFLYLFRIQENGRLSLMGKSDVSECPESAQKAAIDLMSYPVGEYLVGVTGFADDFGYYYVRAECVHYTFPMTPEQVDPPPKDMTTTITCDDTERSGYVSSDILVNYFSLIINESINLPAEIHMISANYTYDPYLHIVRERTEGLFTSYEIVKQVIFDDGEDITQVTNITVIIPEDYEYGQYWIVTQAFFNTYDSDYTFHFECAPLVIPPPQIPEELMIAMVFGAAGGISLLLMIYYCYQWIRYVRSDKNENDNVAVNIPPSKVNGNQTSTAMAPMSPMTTALQMTSKKQQIKSIAEEGSDDDDDDMPQPGGPPPAMGILGGLGGNSMSMSLGVGGLKGMMRGQSKPGSKAPERVRGISIRRLDSTRAISQQLNEDEDVVQAALAHAIDCCGEEEEFDIYQVLAIRYYDVASHKVRGFQPFVKFGITTEFIRFSPFFQAAFVAFIIAVTQIFGVSVVVYNLVFAYFHGNDALSCDMDYERWQNVLTLKVLALLLSLIVTFFISVLLNGVKHNGLYEMMGRLELQHIQRVNNIALCFVQIGQICNFFVCLMAVLGSYFIIFSANQGEELDDGSIDYSQAGLDIILNAVALFFMLELDDMMVTDDDYEVCLEHLQCVLENYEPNIRINEQYDRPNMTMNEKYMGDVAEDADSNSIPMNKSSSKKCSSCWVAFMYHFVNAFGFFVTLCCFGGGFVAPFIIFICW